MSKRSSEPLFRQSGRGSFRLLEVISDLARVVADSGTDEQKEQLIAVCMDLVEVQLEKLRGRRWVVWRGQEEVAEQGYAEPVDASYFNEHSEVWYEVEEDERGLVLRRYRRQAAVTSYTEFAPGRIFLPDVML
ncbi:MAG TPA: hypothetical protein VMR98_01365, partial [Candidatus Polarisedimenticolaceae bacterium]|nr:hypothetical protein [Candidatus Polarisedimenticolaceae bacterium]